MKTMLIFMSLLILYSCNKQILVKDKGSQLSLLPIKPQSLFNDPVQKDLFPFTLPFELTQFNLSDINDTTLVKYDYSNYPNVSLYGISNKDNVLSSLILYNHATDKEYQMNLLRVKINDTLENWNLFDSSGMITAINVNPLNGNVYGEIEGKDPIIGIGPIDSLQPFLCGGGRNITQCAKCVGEICEDHWQCKLLCLIDGEALCYAAHVTVCLIQKAAGNGGSQQSDSCKLNPYSNGCRIKSPINWDTL